MAALGAAACDIKGTPNDQRTVGPTMTILGSNVAGTGAVIPSDGVIQLSFDRYLLPTTVTRQSYTLLDSGNQPIPKLALQTIYDPVARTLSITGPDGAGTPWLTEGLTYRLVLPVPSTADADVGGFRAIDRATLAAPADFSFRAGPRTGRREWEPTVDFCADILPLFTARCSAGACHGNGSSSAAGLFLTTPDGVSRTARGRVAHGSNTSALVDQQRAQGPIFGIDMALIAPGDPGSSWLIYKTELAPHPPAGIPAPPAVTCDAASTPAPAAPFEALVPISAEASPSERAALNDAILGHSMPYAEGPSASNAPLSFPERERLRLWIARGAAVRECGTCSVP